jgi:outer membrane protein TolC
MRFSSFACRNWLTALARPPREALTCLLIAVATQAPANAAEAILTLAEAQRIAVQRSQQLVALEASVTSARHMAVAAGQLPDPVVRLGVDNLPIEGPDRFSLTRDFMTMRRIGVMQEFPRAEKRRFRSERFEREADRATAEKHAALAMIQRDTAIAWLEAFYLERLRSAVALQAEEIRRELQAAEAAYRGGSGSQADVLMTETSRVMLEDRLSELDRRIRNARAMLARWTGPSGADAQLAGEPSLDTVPVHRHELEEQLKRHPNIAAMSQEVSVMEADVNLARANKRPDWTWEVMYQKRGSAFSDMVGIGVSIPLQWDQRNRQDRELAAKLAMADKARAQRDEALRQHAAEVETMLNEWENDRERLRRYDRELLPLARQRTEALVAAYRGGKGDLASALAARRNEIEVRTQALKLEVDIARVWAQLRFLYPDEKLIPAAYTPTIGGHTTASGTGEPR